MTRKTSSPLTSPKTYDPPNAGALVVRIGFGGILYYNNNKEPPQSLF